MVDLEPSPVRKSDPAARGAALWATAVAVPVAILAGLLIFWRLAPGGEPAAAPSPPAASAVAVPATPVQMAAPALPAADARVCLAVTSQLPTTLRNLPGRRVSAGPEQNAAWGEPPLTLACGVPRPVMCERVDGGRPGCVPLDALMIKMNGVCWWAEDGPATDVFTTMDREVGVRVSVPGGYQNTAQWANEFSDPVVRTIRSTTAGLPSGCR